jgi:hypothetical protein
MLREEQLLRNSARWLRSLGELYDHVTSREYKWACHSSFELWTDLNIKK